MAEAPTVSPFPELRPGGDLDAEAAPSNGGETDEPPSPSLSVAVTGAIIAAEAERTVSTLPDDGLSDGTEAVGLGPGRSLLPQPRPIRAAKPARVVIASSGAAVRLSPRPPERPENLVRSAVVRASGMRVQPTPLPNRNTGYVCGDKGIIGAPLAPIPGRIAGCGVSNPVRVVAVDGVTLSQGSTMNCATAKALKSWVRNSVKPTVGRLGGGVATLKVAAHYSCRTRNNQPGAKISEHGKGNAIDISAIILKNGVALTVLRGWRDAAQGKLLRAMHRGACGPFGTVLGPNADRHHQDHFHFDVARHRGGAYCR